MASLSPFPIRVRVSAEPDGTWRVSVGAPDAAPVEGWISEEEVRRVMAAWVALPRIAEAMPNAPAAKARWDRLEDALGHALGHALASFEAGWACLEQLREQAATLDRPVVLAIEAPDLAVRQLPWELLARPDAPTSLEEAGEAVVVRLTPGAVEVAQTRWARTVHLRSWTQGDPALHLRARQAVDSEAARWMLGPVDPLQEPMDPLSPRALEELHLFLAGRLDASALALEGVRPTALPSPLLQRALPRAFVTVLWTSTNGNFNAEILDSLPQRIVRAGAPTVLAPRTRVPEDWMLTAVAALHDSLLSGEPIAMALATARHVLRGQRAAHPEKRPWNLALHVSGLSDVVLGARLQVGWSPPGWPSADASLSWLLESAVRIACTYRSGFVGLEHLALALAEQTMVGEVPQTQAAQRALAAQAAQIREALERLVPRDSRATTSGLLPATPRLIAYGRHLAQSGSADLELLWGMVAADNGHRFGGLDRPFRTSDSLPSTPSVEPSSWSSLSGPMEAPTHFIVASGPEDGRVLELKPGQSLGRWNTGGPYPDHALYEGTPVVDDRLSRHHLTWMGAGRVRLERRGHALVRWGQSMPALEGIHLLTHGDLLFLTRSTVLRAWRREA